MQKQKSVQISYSLFLDLMRYFCAGQQDEDTTQRIQEAIEEKINKMADRERYQRMVLAKTDKERSELLEEYIKHKKERRP